MKVSINCPKCQTENPPDSKYCNECATQLTPSEEISAPTKTLETPKEELSTGSTFADRYQIVEELGKGGMGRVYKALDTKIKEKIALKLIKPEIAKEKKTIERFSNELKMARMISHRNVCRMFDLGEEKGSHYITMEYVSGQDLKSLIRQTAQLAVPTALSIAKQVCEGLSEAHKLGVIHRDLKPSNIMIDKEGNARIMDFGIARSLKEKGLTGAGVMIGTPDYMPPEQAEAKTVDQRSDIYSLGVILYEMVTGRVPFEGETPLAIAMKHKSEAPKDPKELNAQVPSELSQVILKCLEKDKEKRYQSADDVRSELIRIEKGIPAAEKVVPKRKPITSKEITVTFSLKKLLIPTVVVLAAAAIVYVLFRGRGLDVDSNRVVVAVFENMTGDESLDSIGSIAADWITHGLSQTGLVEVVPKMTALMSSQRIGTESGGLQGIAQLRALARETGAGTVISGAYYLVDETLRFQAKVTDAAHGKLIQAIQPVSGPRESPMEVIGALQQQIMGALAVHFDPLVSTETLGEPPNFEAYREYMLGLDLWGVDYDQARLHFERAIELDPTFMRPRVQIAVSYDNQGEYAKADALYQLVNRNREQLTPLERHCLDYLMVSLQGRNEEAMWHVRQAEKLAPKEPTEPPIKYTIGHTALSLNRPQVTVDTYSKKDFQVWLNLWTGRASGSWAFGHLTRAHHMLGNYKQELKEARRGLKYYPNMLSLRRHEVRALAALGRIDEVKKIIDESLTITSQAGTSGDVMLEAAQELRAHGHLDAYKEVAARAVDWYRDKLSEKEATERKRYGLACALYVAEQWEDSKALIEELAAEKPDNIDYKGYLGTLAARREDREEALRISTELKSIDRPYLFGNHTYRRACIASLLGQREQAVALLREAFAQGREYGVYLHRDMDLEPLRDYPPFQELLRPKG
jgi:serine/threonine protein kinase/tetratricopeptide (TPR) repeat protein